MNRKIQISIFLLSLLLLGGCATITPIRPSKVEKIFEKNYGVGKILFAKVGEPMIRVKDFYVREGPGVQPSDDFFIKAGNFSILGCKDEKYPIVGETKIRNKRFLVIRMIGCIRGRIPRVVGLLIDENGKPYPERLINLEDPFNSYWYSKRISVDPSDLKFHRIKKCVHDKERGYINFEILYTGVSENTLRLLYREYTSKDLARPAFYQTLTYDRKQDIITFKGIKIKVIKADNTGIKYIVLEDPYPKKSEEVESK